MQAGAAATAGTTMENNILKYIWRYSRMQQLSVVALTVVSFPILYMTLELPKWIINDALSGTDIDRQLLGVQLSPVEFLVTLCVLLLTLIVCNGLLKMRINTYKGVIGERMVRRLRFSLMDRLLRFPVNQFSRVSSGEIISTVTAETEPLAGYIGESVALPLFQGGTMLTILIFMFAQDWIFGLVSIALIPVQGYLIPKLQKQVNTLKKERVFKVRQLSERIGEAVSGSTEIRLQGTENYTLGEFSRRFGDLFRVRLEIFRKKFFMKFLNNTIGQITPFLFYLFGGYLVLKGDLTIGALVAAIGAYKDLTSPWKELLNHYQQHEDAKIKYQQIIELFNPQGLHKPDTQPEPVGNDKDGRLQGNIEIRNLSFVNDSNERVLSGISLDIPAGSTVAITGDYTIRRARLAQILAGLDTPSGGSISIGGRAFDRIPQHTLRTRLAFLGPDPHLFVGTILDNMTYGLNHLPPQPSDTATDENQNDDIQEARASGNSEYIAEGSWVDNRLTGITTVEQISTWYLDILNAIGSSQIVYERSLLEIFDPREKPGLAQNLLAARKQLRRLIIDHDLSSLVELFDPDVYNRHASIAENILFGVAIDDRLGGENLAASHHLHKVLDNLGLRQKCVALGMQASQKLLERLPKLPAGSPLISQFGLDRDERVEALTGVVERHSAGKKLTADNETLLLDTCLSIIVSQPHLVNVDARTQTTLLQARRDFSATLPESLRGSVIHFDPDEYHPRLTVTDNLLFGRIQQRNPEAEKTLRALINTLIDEADIRSDLAYLLGESQVGISGSRLPTVAKHRIAMGRALLKRPDILIFHDALSPLDRTEQANIRQRIRDLLPDITLIWIAEDAASDGEFDKVFEFTEPGPLIEIAGQWSEISHAAPSVEKAAESSNDPIELIGHSVLFSSLKPDQHLYLAEHSEWVRLPANKVVYEFGDTADAAWLVVDGSVESYRNDDRIMGQPGPMEVFGAMEILAERNRILSVRTKTDVRLLRIDARAIEDLADNDAKVTRVLLRALTMQWTDGEIRAIAR